ncbi:TPA: capsular biosynthesis protein [Photobacterium damselae]
MIINTGYFFQVYTFITLVFCGLVQYFTGIGAVLWLPFLIAMAMPILWLMQRNFEQLALDYKEKVVLFLFLGFFIMAVLSTFIQNGVIITIVGLKNELALSLILCMFLLGFCRESQIYRITQSLYLIFYIQLPIIIYQVFVIVPQRVASEGDYEKWDSVVGSFGGNPMGGGNSAAMGLFCLLIMLLKLSEYKHGTTSRANMIVHVAIAFFLCILGEIKFVILISPLLMAYVWVSPSYIKGVKSYDMKMIIGIIAGMFLLISVAITILAASYQSAFGADPSKSSLDIFMDSAAYVFDPHYVMPSGALGRMTTIFFWLENGDHYGLPSLLFGYGLNATNHGSAVSPGFLNILFNVEIDTTSLSMILWELGIIGTLFFIGMVLYILKICKPYPLINKEDLDSKDIELISYIPAFNAFALGGLLTLPYSQILMLTSMLQFLFYYSLGANLVIRHSIVKVAR